MTKKTNAQKTAKFVAEFPVTPDSLHFITEGGCHNVQINGLDRPVFFAHSSTGFFLAKLNAHKGMMNLGEILDSHLISGAMNWLSAIHTGYYHGTQEIGLHLKFSNQELRLAGSKKSVGYVRALYQGDVAIEGMDKLTCDTMAGQLDLVKGKLVVAKVHAYVKGEYVEGQTTRVFTDQEKAEQVARAVVSKMTAADWVTAGVGFTLKPLFRGKDSEKVNKAQVDTFFRGYIKEFEAETLDEAKQIVRNAVNKTIVRQGLGAAYAQTREAAMTGEILAPVAEVKVLTDGKTVKTAADSLLGMDVAFAQGQIVFSAVMLCTMEVLRVAAEQKWNVVPVQK